MARFLGYKTIVIVQTLGALFYVLPNFQNERPALHLLLLFLPTDTCRAAAN